MNTFIAMSADRCLNCASEKIFGSITALVTKESMSDIKAVVILDDMAATRL